MKRIVAILAGLGGCGGGGLAPADAGMPDAGASDAGADAAPAAEPRFRAVAGVSMGGYAAAHVGLKHSERFDAVACAGGLADMDHFLWLFETHFLGGFRGETDLAWTFEALPDEGQTVLDRNSLVDFFHDFTRGLGNFATYNVESAYWPPGSPGPVAGFFDDEYNPDGKLPAITFLDGEAGDLPMEVLLAVDLDGDGARGAGEPVVRDFAEPWRDVGPDGLANADEPGFDATANPDPSGDDYDPLANPSGTEGNLRLDPGEPCEDVGLDGIAGTAKSPWDFGEANGACDVNPNLERYFAADPRRLLDGADLARLSVWLDAGIRDVFEFDVGTDRLAGEMRRLGADVATFDAFEALPGAAMPFEAAAVDWAAVPDHVYVRYGNPDATPEEIEAGDGGHVGDFDTVLARFTSMFFFIASRFPGGDTSLASGLGQAYTETFFSEALAREMTYAIFLPPGYDDAPDARFPVVYFLHGYGQAPADLVPALALFLGPLARDGAIAKMIVVIPDGGSLEGTGSAYLDRVAPVEGDTGRYEEYVMDDLIPHVEGRYRTAARDP